MINLLQLMNLSKELMKLSFKKILSSKLSVKLRNFFGIRPVSINSFHVGQGVSISDSFLWRTDNNLVTKFKYADILNLFYNLNDSKVEIIFYDKFNVFIKKLNLSDIKLSNDLLLDKLFFDGIEDYGIFNIFHESNSKVDYTISNRCYTGFSFNGNLSSYVHGNSYVNYRSFNNNETNTGIIGTSFLKNNKYFIQNYFNDNEKVELFFANPSKDKVYFSINEKEYFLSKGFSKIVDVSEFNKVEIISNCYFLRPIIFSYSKGFLDVYHG